MDFSCLSLLPLFAGVGATFQASLIVRQFGKCVEAMQLQEAIQLSLSALREEQSNVLRPVPFPAFFTSQNSG